MTISNPSPFLPAPAKKHAMDIAASGAAQLETETKSRAKHMASSPDFPASRRDSKGFVRVVNFTIRHKNEYGMVESSCLIIKWSVAFVGNHWGRHQHGFFCCQRGILPLAAWFRDPQSQSFSKSIGSVLIYPRTILNYPKGSIQYRFSEPILRTTLLIFAKHLSFGASPSLGHAA